MTSTAGSSSNRFPLGARLQGGLAERPTPKDLEARAEPWRSLRSVASRHLWRLVHAGQQNE